MRLFLAPVVLVASMAAGAPLPREDYQKKADEPPWSWSDERATPEWSAKQLPARYSAEMGRQGAWGERTVRILKDGKVVHHFRGHFRTVFAVRHDVLYYAEFDPICSGCSVVAYDLRQRKQLWKAGLEGMGPIAHSKYRNAVNLGLEKYAVCVRGQESAGNYIEFVDLRTGKTVGHKTYPRK